MIDSETTDEPFPVAGILLNSDAPLSFSGGSNDGTSFVCVTDDENTLYAVDLKRKQGLCWLRGRSQFEKCLPARPLRHIIHWWMTPQHYQLMHAGAIGNSSGAIVLLGPSGSGKSTVCLNMLARGWDYLGDDFVLLGPGRENPGLSVFNAYSWARVDRLPESLHALQSESLFYERKFAIPLIKTYGNQIRQELPVKAFVCLFMKNESDALVPISSPQAFRRAICTLGYLPGFETITLQNISNILSAAPSYALDAQRSIEAIEKSLSEIA
ncbi:MAG: hypothetical protein K2Z81_25870 [Cyanobacteria bacterium]|nr:hypothetical protein [Cyanobacteriota bacterium]